MHKKSTVVAALGVDPEQVEIRSKVGGNGGEGELCCSHAGDQKRCHWEKSSGLVSFCFFGSRRPDARWMFVFFGLLSSRFLAVLLYVVAIMTVGTQSVVFRRHS